MNKSSTSQTMGSGGGGILSTMSNNNAHSSFNGSSAGVSSLSSNSNTRNDCVKCTYCQNSLGNISVKCSECFNFYLCLKCFSMSAEIGEHKKDHNYLLKSMTSFPIFDSEKLWTYKEELHLLQFIEQYGYDNWEEIAKHLPNRTAQECMQHYHSYYIYGNLGKNTFITNLKYKLNAIPLKQQLSIPVYTPINDPSLANKLEMTTTVLLPPIEMSLEEQRALGYMPLRDDFEREYKNDGETLLSNLNIANNQLVLLNENINIDKLTNGGLLQLACSYTASSGLTSHNPIPTTPSKQESNSSSIDPDDVVDFEIKLTLIEMYRECLQERQRFKQIAREYGLINNTSALLNEQKVVFAQQASNGTLLAPNGLSYNHVSNKRRIKKPEGILLVEQKEMSEVNEKLKKYAQFMSVSEYETLIENLRKQRHICKKIQELHTYRSHYGLQKIADVEALKKEQQMGCKMSLGSMKPRKRKRKSYHLFSESPNKRMTRRQNNNDSVLYTSVMSNKMENTLNDTGLSDLNISNIRNFSPTNSTNTSRSSSSSSNRSRSNSHSNSSNSMNIYELVDKSKDLEDLISEDRDDDDSDSENNENNLANNKEKIFTDEEGENENETSEDLSSAGAASSGGSGINEPNAGLINNFGRRLRALNNRRNNSLHVKKNKMNRKLNMSLNASSTSAKSRLNASMKRTNELLKSAKSPVNGNGKMMAQKLKLLDLQKNGRSERLCSMPGYNLLSENEKKLISSIDLKPSDYIMFKTNLIKNSLARRNKQRTSANQTIANFFSPISRHQDNSNNSINLNETCPNPSALTNNNTPSKIGSMMRRRHSINGNDAETNSTVENLVNSFTATASALQENVTKSNNLVDTDINQISAASPSKKSQQNSKFMTILMKTTCPKYYQIPNSSRKRILRFLCDNGWIDVS